VADRMQVRFWGVRGTYPVPGAATLGVGGNTPCVEVKAWGHRLILDAGTGIIGLGDELVAESSGGDTPDPIVVILLFSHTHHDHTQGFPFFAPTYVPSSTVYIFGPRVLSKDLASVLSQAMISPLFPVDLESMGALKVIRNVSEGERIVLAGKDDPPLVCNATRSGEECAEGRVVVEMHKSYAHPKDGVIVYRISSGGKSVVYATDIEGYEGGDRRLAAFARNADLLIHDAEYSDEEYLSQDYPKQGWGHSTWRMATGVANVAQVKRLALFHHDPRHDDRELEKMEKEAQAEFKGAFLAREGLEIDL